MQHTQEKIESTIKDLTNDEVIRFLNERLKQHNCWACLANDWALVGGGEYVMSMLAVHKNGTFTIPPPSVPVFALACNNCGYIRSHALGLVAAWKLDKEVGSA